MGRNLLYLYGSRCGTLVCYQPGLRGDNILYFVGLIL